MTYLEAMAAMVQKRAHVRRVFWDDGFYWFDSFGDTLEHSDTGDVYYAPNPNDEEMQASDWEIC
jgi:hypothetical protein